MKISLLIAALVFLSGAALYAQNGAPLAISDSGKHHVISQTVNVPGVSKSVLYSRMKGWVNNALNPSDTYLEWDETGNDSVTTIAYLTFDDANGLVNQLFEFKAQLRFVDGQVTLYASDILYQGTRKSTGEDFELPLNRLARRLGDNGAQYIRSAFDGVWSRLGQSMQAARDALTWLHEATVAVAVTPVSTVLLPTCEMHAQNHHESCAISRSRSAGKHSRCDHRTVLEHA